MMKQTMKISLLLLTIPMLSACSLMSTEHGNTADINHTRQSTTSTPELVEIPAPDPAIILLAKRQTWCLLSESERLQVDAVLRSRSNTTSLFQRLMLNTCEPEKNATQIRSLIAALDSQMLSDAERALLSLIDNTNRSLLQSQRERDTLHAKLRKTIDGISDIETQINSNETQQLRGQQ